MLQEIQWLECPFKQVVHPTSLDDFDTMESNLLCNNEKVYINLPQEPE